MLFPGNADLPVIPGKTVAVHGHQISEARRRDDVTKIACRLRLDLEGLDLASEALFRAQQQRIVAPVCTDVVNHMRRGARYSSSPVTSGSMAL